MKKLSLLAALSLLIVVSPGEIAAQDTPQAKAVEPKSEQEKATPKFTFSKNYPASKIPDRVALTISGDPATTISVTWRTSKLSKPPFGEIARSTSGPEFQSKKQKVAASTQEMEFRFANSYYHTVTFKGLQPGTSYVYRVGSDEGHSEWNEFKTAEASDEPFSFVYFGDSQNNIKAMWSRVTRRSLRDMPNAAFFLHAGDLINGSENDNDWGEWFFAGGWINRSIPIVATPGNHEHGSLGLSRHWRTNFEFPLNGAKGLAETSYYFDYQGTRFVSLNTSREIEKQAAWLDRILTNNPSNWTILTGHHPFYSPARNRNNSKLRAVFEPVFKKHRIDLCLQGHDHAYSRSYQTRLTKELNTNQGGMHVIDGTVFAVSVSGPKMYASDKKKMMQRVAEGTQLYQLIRVEKDSIHYRALTASGELYDEFKLEKQDGHVKIVDLTPNSPERRLPQKEEKE